MTTLSNHKNSFLILFICLIINGGFALHGQSNQITITGSAYKGIEKSVVQKAFILDIDRSLFKAKNQKSASQDMISLDLILGAQKFELDLFEDDLISTSLIQEMNEKELSVPLTYEGYTSEGERARITINEGFIYGFIESGDKTFYIEPATYTTPFAQKNAFVLYDGKKAMNANALIEDYMCGYTAPITKSKKQKESNITESAASMACRGLKIAIASDHTMWAEYGSETGVNNHNVGVLNNVQGDYDAQGNGAFDIEFQIVAQHSPSAVGNNPYSTTGTDAGVLLNEFRTWSLGGGFGVNATSHMQGGRSASGLAVLWTNKNITYGGSNSVVGLASTPGNHSVLEDFGSNNPSGSGYGLRVLQSHEMGHNLSYGHDNSTTCTGSNCIMWPSVLNTTTWSPSSISAINNNLNGRNLTGCFASCTNNVQDLGELGVDCGGVCAPCPCTENDTYESPLNLVIQLDNYAEESSWDIRSSDGTVLHSASYNTNDGQQSKTINNINIANANGIKFSFYDAFGDGICCGYGNGSFVLKDANGATIISGGEFTASTNIVFCIQDDENTCENGIQDNGEQGVDCGGSCTPCITGCTDQNAHNYNSSAQLSNNAQCTTCNDGERNGDETGVDCGGALCGPCDCAHTNYTSSENISADRVVKASQQIISSDLIMANTNVLYSAGTSIILNPGFEVKVRGIFVAQIDGCN